MKMKNLLLTSSLIITQLTSMSQTVGLNAYMQGNYVEIGIDGKGGFEGSNIDSAAVPAGMHWRSNTQNFGFVANPQMDGWINFDGDYYTPGSPENGWGIEFIDTTTTDTFNIKLHNNRLYPGAPDIPGSITSYTNVGGLKTVNWHGDYISGTYDLDFDIEYKLYDVDLFYTTKVTIFNNGPANIEELYYYRNIDPDNNIMLSGDYVTTNTIVSQLYCCTTAVVKAEQTTPWASTFAFLSSDTNARVTMGGFSNRDASDLWNGFAGHTITVGSVNTADEAVSISFYQPGLSSFTRAGTSTATFEFKTVFDATTLSTLMTGTGINDENGIDDLNIYPNPAQDVLNISTTSLLSKVTLYNALGTVVYYNANANSTGLQIDISSLKSGMYFLNLEGEKGNVTKKIVKK